MSFHLCLSSSSLVLSCLFLSCLEVTKYSFLSIVVKWKEDAVAVVVLNKAIKCCNLLSYSIENAKQQWS